MYLLADTRRYTVDIRIIRESYLHTRMTNKGELRESSRRPVNFEF